MRTSPGGQHSRCCTVLVIVTGTCKEGILKADMGSWNNMHRISGSLQQVDE